jgi:hypothetical protein
MTDGADWQWGVSNAGSGDLALWLEPWADEIIVPSKSTVTMRIVNACALSSSLDVEKTEDHLVIWGTAGDCIEVYVDNVVQDTGSATIPVPREFGTSSKNILEVLFNKQPSARLAGRSSPNVLGRLRRFFRFLISVARFAPK